MIKIVRHIQTSIAWAIIISCFMYFIAPDFLIHHHISEGDESLFSSILHSHLFNTLDESKIQEENDHYYCNDACEERCSCHSHNITDNDHHHHNKENCLQNIIAITQRSPNSSSHGSYYKHLKFKKIKIDNVTKSCYQQHSQVICQKKQVFLIIGSKRIKELLSFNLINIPPPNILS